jgi:hypothetical protein
MPDYMGQYHGWHFFVDDAVPPSPEFIEAGMLPSGVIMATAIPRETARTFRRPRT